MKATMAASQPRQRILFLDAYDSFSNNITSLLTTLLDVDVFVLPIDSPLLDPLKPSSGDGDVLGRELSHYAAVVCGPGPGSPGNSRDVGLMSRVWTLAEQHRLPVLGICLGFQSLVLAAGGKVRRLRQALHGMVRDIAHPDDDIFAGVGDFRATLYHSLCGDLGQDALSPGDWQLQKFMPFPGAPALLPLAWVEEPRSAENGAYERVLMAVRHRDLPFWGLQYHPESVCTENEGNKVVLNWFRLALRWNQAHGRTINGGPDLLAGKATRPSLLSQTTAPSAPVPSPAASATTPLWRSHGLGFRYSADTIPLPPHVAVPDIVESLQLQHVTTDREQIVLDSANASAGEGAADVRGHYSIIALDVPDALRLEHHVGDGHVTAHLPRVGSTRCREDISLDGHPGIWHFLARFHDERRLDLNGGSSSSADSPFLGGFMGFVTYEQGLSGIHVAFPANRGHHRPDICFAWVTRSVVVDHAKRLVHIQHLHPPEAQGQAWIDATIDALRSSPRWRHPSGGDATGKSRRDSISSRLVFSTLSVDKPAVDEYESKVEMCQDYIAAGESYELCLTDQTVVRRATLPGDDALKQQMALQNMGGSGPGTGTAVGVIGIGGIPNSKRRRRSSANTNMSFGGGSSAWQLFRALRARQPAPFASYVRLGGATLVSSSPERFLQYDRQGLCSMRPMKGTVRKSAAVPTLREAGRILHVPKEEAENLMIVDLVRHDLHGICGPGNVSVRDLMRVEEYRSVFQMTTVVEGQLPLLDSAGKEGAQVDAAATGTTTASTSTPDRYTGLDVLAASLPPGSMTGAPKKRSCEILQKIEGHHERSLYSGVVGYMCVSGRGDWSVTIRSMFRWDDEACVCPSAAAGPDVERAVLHDEEAWHIGAGGAVTILSTPQGEREEMFIKLAGPMGIFSTHINA